MNKIFQSIKDFFSLAEEPGINSGEREVKIHADANWFGNPGGYSMGSAPYMVQGYDGETNLGAVGPVKLYVMETEALRWRARQAYIEDKLCQTLVDRQVMWVVGKGLKLQSEPKVQVLEALGVSMSEEQAEAFSDKIEAFMSVYATSTMCDYSGQKTLAQLTAEAEHNRVLSGDMLVILRVEDYVVKIQHIDASLVSNPLNLEYRENTQTAGFDYVTAAGNRVRQGVEIDAAGNHVAYYVKVGAGFQHKRVLARGPRSGMLMAYMVYGKKQDLNTTRGITKLAANIETSKIMDRYVKATVSAAEQRANIPLFFEHNKESMQEDPAEGIRAKMNAGFLDAAPQADLPLTNDGILKLNNAVITEGNTLYDLPKGVTIKAIESKQEALFEPFISTHIDMQAASFGMPPTVATGKYDGSFSSSRVGTKDWEHTIDKERLDLSSQYLVPIYALQMYMLVLRNYLDAMPYVNAIETGNKLIVSAYLGSRWVGDKFPDIDQRKSAQALRELLGGDLANAPLIDLESAAEEAGGGGDYKSIIRRIKKQKISVEQAGIAPVQQKGSTDEMSPKENDSEETEAAE